MHYSVGALIEKDGKFLLIDRVQPPLGFAAIAGHVDVNEDDVAALSREVLEESGLSVKSFELLAEEELDWNTCSKGIAVHYWKVFKCVVSGSVRKNSEAKSIGWYSREELRHLALEPVWKYWFGKLGIL
jgi:8-oxo-dGTP pyrophosphatase MutT (NUDIX family)